MGDRVSIPMSLPLDSDRFLRRECPTCEREFKWLPAQNTENETPAPRGGYFCPYCAVQAPPNSWFTKAQLELAKAKAFNQVVQPQLDNLRRSLQGLNQSSGAIRISASMQSPESLSEPDLVESDDMQRVDFGCHDEPIKVLDEWEGPVPALFAVDRLASVREYSQQRLQARRAVQKPVPSYPPRELCPFPHFQPALAQASSSNRIACP